jgi:hypothetical protein
MVWLIIEVLTARDEERFLQQTWTPNLKEQQQQYYRLYKALGGLTWVQSSSMWNWQHADINLHRKSLFKLVPMMNWFKSTTITIFSREHAVKQTIKSISAFKFNMITSNECGW